MRGWDIWLTLWSLWGVVFFAIEIPAVLNKVPGDTLSEHVWRFLATFKPGTPVTGWVRIRRILFMAFWAWLTAHFFFQFS